MADMKEQIDDLQNKIDDLRGDPDQTPLMDFTEPAEKKNWRQRRVLKGHFGKIYAMHFDGDDSVPLDDKKLVSASQDGKLIIWNAISTNKLHVIPLRSSWVMTCAYSKNGMVACGGLDNLCSVYKVPNNMDGNTPSSKPAAELAQHEGYLSCCRFVNGDDKEIITSSGDSTCIMWDVETKTPKAVFNSHTQDVMSVSIMASNSTFVSGSCDANAKLWDYRARNNCVHTFPGHESDINSVQFFPDGNAFGTGSDDSSCRLFDIRAYKQLNKYSNDKILCGITSVAFSKSGCYMFGGYDDYYAYVWDTVTGELMEQIIGHENRVSCLGVSNDGNLLCTGSWDTLLKIWC